MILLPNICFNNHVSLYSHLTSSFLYHLAVYLLSMACQNLILHKKVQVFISYMILGLLELFERNQSIIRRLFLNVSDKYSLKGY